MNGLEKVKGVSQYWDQNKGVVFFWTVGAHFLALKVVSIKVSSDLENALQWRSTQIKIFKD